MPFSTILPQTHTFNREALLQCLSGFHVDPFSDQRHAIGVPTRLELGASRWKQKRVWEWLHHHGVDYSV
jgi:hypothetical protein